MIQRFIQKWRWGSLSGALAAIPALEFRLWPLLFVALVPFLFDLLGRTPRAAWGQGYRFGLVYGAIQLFWMLQFVGKWTGSYLIGAVPWVIATLLCAMYFGLAGIAITKCFSRGWWWLVPIVWAGSEVLRSYLPVVAFPWGIYAMPLSNVPALMGLARYGMIYLVSAWLVLVNVSVLMYALRQDRPGILKPQTAAPVIGISLLLASIAIGLQPITGENRRVQAIQPGVDLAFGDPSTEELRLQASIDPMLAAADEENPYLIVLPEGIAPADKMPPKAPFRLPQSAVVFGGQRGVNPRFQSSFAYAREVWQYSDKTRLVIFGEFVPFRQLLPASFKLPSGDLVPGQEGIKGFRIERDTVGPLLCFEALFPDLAYRQQANGANLLAIMSIDDWFMGTAAVEQLRAAAIWRAVETGLPVIRVGSLGSTLIIDQRGRVMVEAPRQLPYRLTGTIAVDRPVAPIFNGWFGILAGVAVVGMTLLPRKKAPARSDVAAG